LRTPGCSGPGPRHRFLARAGLVGGRKDRADPQPVALSPPGGARGPARGPCCPAGGAALSQQLRVRPASPARFPHCCTASRGVRPVLPFARRVRGCPAASSCGLAIWARAGAPAPAPTAGGLALVLATPYSTGGEVAARGPPSSLRRADIVRFSDLLGYHDLRHPCSNPCAFRDSPGRAPPPAFVGNTHHVLLCRTAGRACLADLCDSNSMGLRVPAHQAGFRSRG